MPGGRKERPTEMHRSRCHYCPERKEEGTPSCPYLEVSLRRVLWLKKGTVNSFLSNLVRTSPACSVLGPPRLKSARRVRTTAACKSACGAGMFPGKTAQAGIVRSQARPAERVLASLLNSLCSVRAPRYLLCSVLAAPGQASRGPGPHPGLRTREGMG